MSELTEIKLDDVEIDCNMALDDDINSMDLDITNGVFFSQCEDKPGNGMINNPFFMGIFETPLKVFDKKTLYSNYKKCYVLCTRDNIVMTDDDKTHLLKFYDKTIPSGDLAYFSKFYTLVESSVKLLKTNEHYYKTVIINTDHNILQQFNSKNYVFNNFDELVIILPELTEKIVAIYSEIYKPMSFNNSVFDKILIDSYYNNNGFCPDYNRIRTELISLPESNFWTYQHNCNFNITSSFKARKFNYDGEHINDVVIVRSKNTLDSRDFQVKEFIQRFESTANNDSDDDDLEMNNYGMKLEKAPKLQPQSSIPFLRNYTYVDMSLALKTNNRTYYAKNNDLELSPGTLTIEYINNIFSNLNVYTHERQLYDLFNTLLISKEYCHLVINNSVVLDKMKIIINKYYDLYRYLFGYAWTCMYMEECIFKTLSTKNMRHIFDINTASKLPIFPVISSDLHSNPYLVLPINSSDLDSETNCMSLPMNVDSFEDEFGVCDLQTFQKRFNLFSFGDSNTNILNGLNWNNIAISGSVIPACLHKKSQLVKLVSIDGISNISEDEVWQTYFNHYYNDSDIDLMVNLPTMYEFLDKINDIIQCINVNLDNPKIQILTKKSFSILISHDFIKQHLSEIQKLVNYEITFEEILQNPSTMALKDYFYKIYIDEKLKLTEIQKMRYDDSSELYQQYMTPTSIDDMNIYIISEIYNKKKYINDCEIVLKNEKNGIAIKINESVRIKLTSSKLLHDIECFRTQTEDFFGTVARFHLPCVRAFYTGNNVYMLPSCFTAMSTGINIDYKYFAGIRDPIDILNKYKARGFGTILNSEEKNHMTLYNTEIKSGKWFDVYKSFDKNKYLGFQSINSLVYKPLVYLQNILPEAVYCTLPEIKTFNSNSDVINYMKKHKNYDDTKMMIDTMKLRTYSKDGSINKMKKWILEARYDNNVSNTV